MTEVLNSAVTEIGLALVGSDAPELKLTVGAVIPDLPSAVTLVEVVLIV